MIEAQHHYAGHQQQFVRQRIEDRSQFAALVVTAGDIAVHPVADRRRWQTSEIASNR